jgi:hypothetical protein
VRTLTGYWRAIKNNLSIEKATFEDHTDALLGREDIFIFLARLTKKSERTCGRRRDADF